MRALTMSELEMVDGGIIKGIISGLITEAIIYVGGQLIDYAQTAPDEVFERERAAL